MKDIITPYVKIDILKVEENIKHMVHYLKKNAIQHRPHIKTHKSVELAKLELEHGAIGITCATLTEVKVMAANGVNNILLAYPLIGEKEWDVLYEILKVYNINFTTIVDSEIGLEGLNEVGSRLKRKINVYIDINSGGNRGGIRKDAIVNFANLVTSKQWIELAGLFTYYGHINKYKANKHKLKTKNEASILLQAKQILEEHNFKINVLSGGSTISSNNPAQLKGITESRAGNFIFYDMNAVYNEVATIDQCALKVVAKVVSKPAPGKLTLDAGSKALTTDTPLKGNLYGYIPSHPDLKIVNLNEEHGFVEYDVNKIDLEIGEEIEIIPNHACVIPNLYNRVFLFRESKLLSTLEVNARGRDYF